MLVQGRQGFLFGFGRAWQCIVVLLRSLPFGSEEVELSFLGVINWIGSVPEKPAIFLDKDIALASILLKTHPDPLPEFHKIARAIVERQ